MAKITDYPKTWTYSSLVTPSDMNRLESYGQVLLEPDYTMGTLSSNITTTNTSFTKTGLFTNYTIDVVQTVMVNFSFMLTTSITSQDVLLSLEYSPVSNPSATVNVGSSVYGNAALYRARLANAGDFIYPNIMCIVPDLQPDTYRFEVLWRVTAAMTATAYSAGSNISVFNNL